MQASPWLSHELALEDGPAVWLSERHWSAPGVLVIGDDQCRADDALRLWRGQGVLLWQGDFHQAKQLLQAVQRRMQQRIAHRWQKAKAVGALQSPAAVFALHRQLQGEMAAALHRLLVPLVPGYHIPLRRAPAVAQALEWAWGPWECLGVERAYVSLRELLGMLGAAQWRQKGVPVAALAGLMPGPSGAASSTMPHIVPFYGVYSPVRGEYLELLAKAPWPSAMQAQGQAMDVGTGTGVVAALLAWRGASKVWATDLDPRAVACAQHNVQALGLTAQVKVLQADLFAPQRVGLVVCNPPWLPAQPTSPLERTVYDPGHAMLWAFISGVKNHLLPGGQAWLVLSDLAEHLQLRSREQLLQAFADAGLQVASRLDVRPQHPKVQRRDDPLHLARAQETTTLWCLQEA